MTIEERAFKEYVLKYLDSQNDINEDFHRVLVLQQNQIDKLQKQINKFKAEHNTLKEVVTNLLKKIVNL